MADDFPNDATTTGIVSPGVTSSGNLETTGDIDWFATSLQAGLIYQFTISATTTTTNPTSLNVALKNNTGVLVVGHNGSSGYSTKTITYTPTSSGTYYVQADAYGNSLGPYQLTESPLDDYTNTLATIGRIAPGQTLGAGLQADGDVDWFAITLTAGYNYQFTIAGTTTTVNPTSLNVALTNSTGVLVGGHNGSSGYSTKTITYTPTSSGTYYVQADSYNNSLGAYQLSASPQDDYAANGTTTGHLTGNSITGSLEAANDVDWISVTLSAGSTYGFTIAATASTISPTGLNLALLNGTGVTVAGSTSSTTKTVTYTPTTSGTYYLAASSYGGSSLGGYTISSNSASGSAPGASTTSVPVYRFFDTHTGTQFLTSSTSERDTVINTRADLSSEGVGLYATPSTSAGATPIYRFFDNTFGTHFFTQSASELATIQASRPDLTYEGVGFYDYATQQAGTTPVYRFFDSNAGTHFFTSSATERATILSSRPDLIAEGISFYAPTS